MKKVAFLTVLAAFAFSLSREWALDTVRISRREDMAKSSPKARDTDPKRFIGPRFLKELKDNFTVARLYR